MRILFIIGNLDAGGAEKVVSTLANSFSDANDVGILMISASESTSFYELNQNVKLIPLLKSAEKLSYFKKVRKIRDEISSFNPDIVISFLNYVIIYSWLAIRKIKKSKNIKFIVSERNNPKKVPSTILFRAIRNHIFSKADGCVFQTNDSVEYFKNIKSKKVIPNPVFLNQREQFNYLENNRDKTVLLVGSNKKEKNRPMAYKAFRKFLQEQPEYKMIVVGSYPKKKESKLINKLGIQSKIQFVGKDNNWHTKYYSAGMFILTSDYEGMPNALLEAAALQIPCISTNCPTGGPKEILEDGKKGILIKTKHYECLAEQMKKLSSDKALCNKLSDNCSDIKEKYNPQKISNEWMSYIKSIL